MSEGSTPDLQSAFSAHRAGRLEEAERAYRAVLRDHPDHPESLHHVGLIAHQQGRSDEALSLIRRAIGGAPGQLRYRFNLAHILESSGDTAGAGATYREARAASPAADAVLLAECRVELEAGRPVEAAHLARTVLAASPDAAGALALLGRCRLAQRRPAEAERAFRRALDRQPDQPDAHAGLGALAWESGDAATARMHLDAALAAFPDHVPSRRALAELITRIEGPAAGLPHWQAVCESAPGDGDLRLGLARALEAAGDPAASEAAALTASKDARHRPRALSHLAGLAAVRSDYSRALELAREAATLDPGLVEAHGRLGTVLNRLNQPTAAQRAFEAALAQHPDDPGLRNGAAWTLVRQGRVEEGYARFQPLLAEANPPREIVSNYLLALNYRDGDSPAAAADEHRRWGARWEAEVPARSDFANNPDPERPLEIGFLSASLRMHPVSLFLERGLAAWDHAEYRLTCYATVPQADAVTERVRGHAGRWREVSRLDDAELERAIMADGIDILVALDGHDGHSRIGACLGRAAPVQVSYLGYPQTTGLTRIDYYLSDAGFTPPAAQSYFSERLYLLPRFFACYTPPAGAPEPLAPPMLRDGGPVRFGSWNNIMKLSPRCVALWCRVLATVPGSRLLLRAPQIGEPEVRRLLAARFAEAGLEPGRLELVLPTHSQSDYFADFGRIDIALDPVPFNGVTTTCDALWMGVPVVTLEGSHGYNRGGASILEHLGRPEWIARDEDEYVGIAAALAADPAGLAATRAGLRTQLAGSQICDGEGFARAMEAAFRDMWRTWCRTRIDA